jgi:hypothetical protein
MVKHHRIYTIAHTYNTNRTTPTKKNCKHTSRLLIQVLCLSVPTSKHYTANVMILQKKINNNSKHCITQLKYNTRQYTYNTTQCLLPVRKNKTRNFYNDKRYAILFQ